MDTQKVIEFQQAVWDYFTEHGRHSLPWRMPEDDASFDPYKIMVSELMLQQTQVTRVIVKYDEFLQQFPTTKALARASPGEVLIAWQGLGYNRRAKFLWQAAQKIMQDFDGEFPRTQAKLETLPGIGPNTAAAILVYARNLPVNFIETNIRTVYIHHFFQDKADIPDKAILELVDETIDRENPREWYWALMDYGTFLKQTVGNLSARSKGYTKQSKFEGSLRQIRGQVIRMLAVKVRTYTELSTDINDIRLDTVLAALEQEKLICHQADSYRLF